LFHHSFLIRNNYKPGPCPGNLTDALHISPQTDSNLVKIVLGYLLIGSYATLFWVWWQNRKSPLFNTVSGINWFNSKTALQ
jgi:hypothetical protein